MKRGALLAAIGVVVVAAGVGATWFYSWSQAAADDERLSDLCREVAAEAGRVPLDVEASQALLLKLNRDPRNDDPRLVRGRAELMLLLGKPTQQVWGVLEELVTASVDAQPEDLLLGARILERRHAETGKTTQAFRSAQLARRHYEATGRAESLMMAWLMSFRAEDKDAAERIASTLSKELGESVSARLVVALAAFYSGYLSNRSVDKAVLETLAALDRQIEEAPPELTIALAARDIDGGSLEQVQLALDRLDALVKSYRSSILARELLALGYVKLKTVQGCEQSLFHLDWLLKNHPDNHAAEVWRNLRPAVRGMLERLRKGPEPVK